MSARALNWAWQQQPRTTSQKLVLAALADRADDEGFCFPSIKWVAAKCAPMTERTVRRAIADLDESGYLAKVERRRRANGTLGAWTYQLSIDAASGHGWPVDEGEPVAMGGRTGTDHKTPTGTDVPVADEDSAQKTPLQRSSQSTPLDLLWDACEQHVQPAPDTKSHRKAYAKLVRELLDAGWTPEMVAERARAYRRSSLTGEWPLTLAALAKWGAVVARKPERPASAAVANEVEVLPQEENARRARDLLASMNGAVQDMPE